MGRDRVYNVTIGETTYRVRGYDEADAREEALNIDIGGRAERKYVRETVSEEDDIRVELDD